MVKKRWSFVDRCIFVVVNISCELQHEFGNLLCLKFKLPFGRSSGLWLPSEFGRGLFVYP